MRSLTSPVPEAGNVADGAVSDLAPHVPHCYSITIFTQQWREVRNFYVEILSARILSERVDRSCEMEIGGLPITIRAAEHGEMVTYLHLYVSIKDRESVLKRLRSRGIIVTTAGPFTNFRDPEGRVIKLSEEKAAVS